MIGVVYLLMLSRGKNESVCRAFKDGNKAQAVAKENNELLRKEYLQGFYYIQAIVCEE